MKIQKAFSADPFSVSYVEEVSTALCGISLDMNEHEQARFEGFVSKGDRALSLGGEGTEGPVDFFDTADP